MLLFRLHVAKISINLQNQQFLTKGANNENNAWWCPEKTELKIAKNI